jgi:hypothetical protein
MPEPEQILKAQMRKMPDAQLKAAINKARAIKEYPSTAQTALVDLGGQGKHYSLSVIIKSAEDIMRLGKAELARRGK